MQSVGELVADHPFFTGLDAAIVRRLEGCARLVRVPPGDYLFREGEPADEFFVVRRGRVALEIHAPGHGDRLIDTVEEGDVVGWSWLIAPYRWFFDARAVEEVSAIAFDATCLRAKCDQDPALGYALLHRVVAVMYQRLQAARVRLLDVP